MIALVVSGCGGVEEDVPTSEQESSPSLKTQDINAQDRGTLAQGGEVRIGTEDLAAYWNPMHVDGNQADWTKIREPSCRSPSDSTTRAHQPRTPTTSPR